MSRFLAGLLLFGAGAAFSQPLRLTDDATLALSGGIQPRASLGVEGADGTERLGYGLRRARLQFRLTLLKRYGMEYDVDTTPGDLRSVDLFAFVQASETVELRAGRLPPAQPRGYVPTSNTRIDAADRAAIVERWARGTLGSSGRDIGVDLTADLGDTEVQVTLHNGTGGFSRDTDNFRESGSGPSVTRGTDETALALSASVHHGRPSGWAYGVFASANARGSERTALEEVERRYVTGGAHLYWGERPGSQPVRLKLDAVATAFESVDGVAQRASGASVLGAVRALPHGEVFVRGERYWDDLDARGDVFGTVGASYSPSAALGRDYRDLRVSLAYVVRRNAEGEMGHLAVLQGQVIF
ncbi:MAG: hypothetical protein AAFQ43_11405 [Bacteroidota bacterium]